MNNKKYNYTLMLAYFLGILGAHRFYNKKYITAIIMLCTFGGLGIWVIIDVVTILMQKFNDNKNNKITYEGTFLSQIGNIVVLLCLIIGFIRTLLYIF